MGLLEEKFKQLKVEFERKEAAKKEEERKVEESTLIHRLRTNTTKEEGIQKN